MTTSGQIWPFELIFLLRSMVMVLLTLAMDLTVVTIDRFDLHLFQIMQLFLKSLNFFLEIYFFLENWPVKPYLHDAIDMCVGVFF